MAISIDFSDENGVSSKTIVARHRAGDDHWLTGGHRGCSAASHELVLAPFKTVEKPENVSRPKPEGDLRLHPTDWAGVTERHQRDGANLFWANNTFYECSQGTPAGGVVYHHSRVDANPVTRVQALAPNWVPELMASANELGFDWWTFAAELPEAAKMFIDIADKLRKGMTAIRKGKLGKQLSKASFADIPNTYFMYNFGIAPLVNDMETLLEKVGLPKTAYLPIKAFAKNETGSIYTPDDGGTVCAHRYSARANALVSFDRDYNPYMNTGSLLGAAWELTYASWIVDYFIPIGDYIASRSVPRGMKIEGVNTSFCSEYRAVQNVDNVTMYGDADYALAHTRWKTLWRTAYPEGLPAPEFIVWSPNLTTKKMLNLGMLLAQRVLT